MLTRIFGRTTVAIIRTSQFRGMATKPVDNVHIRGASASIGEKYVSIKLTNGSKVYVIDKQPNVKGSQ